MNKKFTLLFASALLGGSLLNSAFAERKTTYVDLSSATKGTYYALSTSHWYDGTVGEEDWKLEDTLSPWFVLEKNGSFVRNNTVSPEKLEDNVWTVTTSTDFSGNKILNFKNKAGKEFKIDGKTGFVLEVTGVSNSSTNVYRLDIDNNGSHVAVNSNQVLVSSKNNSNPFWSMGFTLMSLSDSDVSAEVLNSIQGGKGLIFAYPSAEQPTVENDILTGKQLVAIDVPSGFTADNKTVPAGVYFATSVSKDLKLTKDGVVDLQTTGIDKADQLKAFLASEFIAVNPSIPASTTNWDPATGVGYVLTTVVGTELSFESTTKGSTISVNNACFTVAEPDAYTTTNQYTLTVNAKLETEKGKNHAAPKSVAIGVRNVDGKKRLTTHTQAQLFKTQATATSAIVDATTLLNTDKTPAIYAIKVLSGEAKGQYMTNGLYTMPGVDVNDPSNQYVITAVDKKTNKVTFKNRLVGDEFTVSFYGEASKLNYTLVSANGLEVMYADSKESDSINFEPTNLNAETVELVKVTPSSKFDSFVNVDEEDYKLVTFGVAPYAGSADALNLFVDKNDNLKFSNEEEATQFVLTSKKDNEILNTFVSLEGEEVKVATEKDTVAYPSYNISVYDPAILVDNANAKSVSVNGKVVSTSYKGNFAIKENKDGSLFLVNLNSRNSVNNFEFDSQTGNACLAKLTLMEDYVNREYRTFMTSTESASVSLEAKTQHVSMMETVAGGYVTADVNNDAIAKGAEAAAVLWLDTTKTEATIPTFYISQGGKFLYNSDDSIGAKYDVPGTEFAKLIFKKAELVGSDTLKTTVGGRDVFVAAKPNALANVVGGIENFQYQILKAKEENEYVVRQRSSYVQAINGYLALTGDIKDAMHVVIESQAAPTSNENVVVASEVKVVAQNGSVVVKNAAGKNVVVSTILGQVVANEVLTSDNATINVPAGIVVVAVEGESFKVNVK